MKLQDHELAEIFPLMPQEELKELANDIKQQGQKHHIILFEGKILDGRNRYRACLIADVTPNTRDFKGDDPLGFVISANLHRRHLTTSQRAMIAAKIETTKHGGDRKSQDQEAKKPLDFSRKNSSKMMKVSESSVKKAKKILDENPEKVADIEAGKVTVGAAIKQVEKAEENPRGAKDERGKVIPKNCLILWSRRDQVGDMMRDISRIRVQIRQAQDEDDPLFRAINYSTILSQLNQAYADLSAIRPYAVCTCQGVGCKLCHKTGLLGKFAWDKFVPESVK